MIEGVKILKENCVEYAKAKKSGNILRKANGKNHYTKIAKDVGLHPTRTSSLLKKAEKLGLVKKIKPGIYKRIPGVLEYMPENNNFKGNSIKTLKDFSKKVVKKAVISRLKKQFPDSLVIQPRIISRFDKMTMAYGTLYIVENSLRELVRKTLGAENNWWKKYVPVGVRNEVQNSIDKMPYHVTPRNDELEYTHLGQLKEIISNNWSIFLPYLKERDKNNFSATVVKAIPSRNAIGHCIPLKLEDLKIVDVRFQDILKMIK